MVELRNVSIIVVVIVGALLLQSIEAAEYTVGGDIGWTSFPPGGASFYSNWAANFTFKVNDILVFNFESGRHSVAIITKGKYNKCDMSENTPSLATGPARVTLDHKGKFYFACPFTSHCKSGQKLKVKVVTHSSSPISSPSPPPQVYAPPLPSGLVPTPPPSSSSSSSTVSGVIAPPPPPPPPPRPLKGSAMTLPVTFSLLLINVAFHVLLHF
ncbi:hypothetical protein Lal_00040819 [Lupinus albus]|uniref:Putative cupredoxin n=1 Tax=Lupinus albus TaxID=3870 RepID=A0A6A4PJU7_LUPAL|nr:putative cupredoxin [Lupinus albus]KAF1887219.1 hypothetical protein Lal_00040819 [Lupinus albus]